MNESLWVLFSELLVLLINCSVTGIKVFLHKSLLSMSGRVSGFLADLVGSGIASLVAAVLAQCEAFICKEQCFSQALKLLKVNA
jgi:hypothetical protein